MKKSGVPTRINLTEIHEDGETYVFTNETGELNETLKDVVGRNPYWMQMTIRPVGNIYSIQGKWRAGLDLICSRCAMDFNSQVSESLDELIVIEEDMPRTGKTARVNHTSELTPDGPFCNYIKDAWFDLGSFIYEHMVLSQPVRPLGKENCDDTCPNYQEALKKGWLVKDENQEKAHPFQVLKNFKVDH